MWELLSQLFLWACVSGCSLRPGSSVPEVSMEDTLEMAPIVVSGKDVYHAPMGDTGFRNYTFQVSCIFKSNNLQIPRTIFLIDVGAISCDGTNMDTVGGSYVVGLKRASQGDITRGDPDNQDYFGKDSVDPIYFQVYEPDILNSGAFEATAEHLEKTSALCSMDNTTLSLGAGGEDDHDCPVREVSTDTCVSLSGASSVLFSPGKLTPYNSKILGLLVSMAVCAMFSLVLVI